MIGNTGLNGTFKPSQDSGASKPIPAGEYLFIVDEIKPWEKHVKDIWINLRDENNQLIYEGASVKKELYKDVEFYTAKVILKVADGDFKGRPVYTSITTHPNAAFITENFLYAVDLPELTAGEIPKQAVGKMLKAEIEERTYNKKTKDPQTGLVTETPKSTMDVVAFIKPDFINF